MRRKPYAVVSTHAGFSRPSKPLRRFSELEDAARFIVEERRAGRPRRVIKRVLANGGVGYLPNGEEALALRLTRQLEGKA